MCLCWVWKCRLYVFYCNNQDIYGVWLTGNMPFIVESGASRYIWGVEGQEM